jgi:hypothetical protein
MLERENDNVLDSLKRGRAIRTREALRKNNSDSAQFIRSVPVPLLQNLAMKWRKTQIVLVPLAIEIWSC